MELWEVAARESIRDVIARFNSNADTARYTEVMKLFTDDAVLDYDGTLYEGKDAIRSMFESYASTIAEAAPQNSSDARYVRHFTSTHQLDIFASDQASARSYFLCILPHRLDHWGMYIDLFALDSDGEWKIRRRRERLEGATQGSYGESLQARGFLSGNV